jgi:hypothetical protein
MKPIIAYALVTVGLPILLGQLVGVVLNFPVCIVIRLTRGSEVTPLSNAEVLERAEGWVLSGDSRQDVRDLIAHISLDVLTGAGAAFAAGLILHLFGTALSFVAPLIVAAWEIFFTVAYGQSHRALYCSLAGVVVGWLLVLWLFQGRLFNA